MEGNIGLFACRYKKSDGEFDANFFKDILILATIIQCSILVYSLRSDQISCWVKFQPCFFNNNCFTHSMAEMELHLINYDNIHYDI